MSKNILHRLGYVVVLFNTPEGDVEIERYNLITERIVLKAFTYYETARIVFIDANLHPEDRLYLLLHELGHIALGHLEGNKILNKSKYLLDIEADAFAYSIIRRRR